MIVWQALEAMPVVPIASLEDGKVARVVGTVEPDQDFLVGPLSGRTCALYEIWIVRARFDAGRTRWFWNHEPSTAIWGTRDARSFAIVDDSGRAGVEPDAFAIDLVLPFMLYIPELRGAPTDYWRRVLTPMLQEGPLCVYEFALAPGDRVTVAGLSTLQPDPAGAARVRDYREHAPMRRVLGGARREPLLISNLPRLLTDS